MIPRNVSPSTSPATGGFPEWNSASPTISGLAHLAARAVADVATPVSQLSEPAKVLLQAAKQRGIFEIRGNPDAFDSTERLLAVCVEAAEGQWWMFKEKSNPRKTMAYLEGFRQLCQAGLVVHQWQREFSLTHAGFEWEMDIPTDYQQELEWAALVEY